MSTRGSFRRTDQVAVLLPLTSLYPPTPQWLAAMKVASVTVVAANEVECCPPVFVIPTTILS
jgi:hypothetical protein